MSRDSLLTRWQRAVRDSALPPVVRHVLLTLGTYMKADGTDGYPGGIRLAKGTGLSLRAVRAALAVAEDAGFIRVAERGGSPAGGKRTSTVYVAQIPTDAPPAPVNDAADAPPAPVAPHPVEGDRCTTVTGAPRLPVHVTTSTGAPGAPQHVKNMIRPSESPFEDDFASVWKLYPRRDARRSALRAYAARRRAGVGADDLLTATRNYAAAVAGRERHYIKLGSTFYGPDDHWRDHLAPPADAFSDNQPSYDVPEVVYR